MFLLRGFYSMFLLWGVMWNGFPWDVRNTAVQFIDGTAGDVCLGGWLVVAVAVKAFMVAIVESKTNFASYRVLSYRIVSHSHVYCALIVSL